MSFNMTRTAPCCLCQECGWLELSSARISACSRCGGATVTCGRAFILSQSLVFWAGMIPAIAVLAIGLYPVLAFGHVLIAVLILVGFSLIVLVVFLFYRSRGDPIWVVSQAVIQLRYNGNILKSVPTATVSHVNRHWIPWLVEIDSRSESSSGKRILNLWTPSAAECLVKEVQQLLRDSVDLRQP